MQYCNFNGKIYEVLEKKENTLIIQDKNVVVKTDINNVKLLDKSYKIQAKNGKTTINIQQKEICSEIMIRHMTKYEAISALSKFIDNAIIQKLVRIKIIHGRHGGVLKEATHEYLKNHPFVKEYYLASFGEGDSGVTIAILGRKST